MHLDFFTADYVLVFRLKTSVGKPVVDVTYLIMNKSSIFEKLGALIRPAGLVVSIVRCFIDDSLKMKIKLVLVHLISFFEVRRDVLLQMYNKQLSTTWVEKFGFHR
jgi:hypothetical protein